MNHEKKEARDFWRILQKMYIYSNQNFHFTRYFERKIDSYLGLVSPSILFVVFQDENEMSFFSRARGKNFEFHKVLGMPLVLMKSVKESAYKRFKLKETKNLAKVTQSASLIIKNLHWATSVQFSAC